MFKKIIKRSLGFAVFGLLAILGVIWFSNYWIRTESKPYLYDTIGEVPHVQTALVLGTSKYIATGGINPYFQYRMEAAAGLFFAKKIEYIIVSGDNSILEYNETKQMKEFLMELGIPAEKIIEDFAGFRTLDSVVRAQRVFGRDSVLVVSQQFHNERAVYIAQQFGIFAVGYNSKNVKTYSSTYREYLARVKAMLDVHLLDTQPRFYQETEIFPTDSLSNE